MPYEIIKVDGGYKVCKKNNHKKCFSKKGLTLQNAEKQMKAIIISENKLSGKGFNQKMYDELMASIPSKAKWEASKARSNRKNDPQTYEEWRKNVEEINKKRAYIDDEANERVKKAIEQARINNEEYARKVAENPDLETVWCNYDENGNPKKTMTTKGQCRINNEIHFREWEKKNHPENYYFFRPAVDTIAKATSFLADVVPMPAIVKKIGKSVAQAGLEANSYTPQEGSGKPKDLKLYNKIKKEVYAKNPKHSLYRSALIQKIYQTKGGEYEEGQEPKMNIEKWFKQDWISLNDYLRGEKVACGNSDTEKKYGEYPLCRPLKIAEKLSKNEIKKMIEEKNKLKEKPLISEKVIARKDVNIKATNTGLGKSKFQKQLQKLNITQDEYLDYAKKIAKLRDYDPDKLELANDDKHKLSYNGVKFGAVGYKDFILYLHLVKEEEIPFEYALQKMTNYRKRAENIKGDWKKDKESPNNLAINILW